MGVHPNAFLVDLEGQIREDYLEVLNYEAELQATKFRYNWLIQGERNTTFFHTSTLVRRKRNLITCIQDNLGNWVEEEEEVAEVIRKGYSNLFCFDKISAPRSVQTIPNQTTHFLEEARCSMVEGISPLDIKTALWSFKPFKAPGPDGLYAGFYQKFWPVVEVVVCKVVLKAFHSGSMPAYLNQTLLVMISKCQGPESIGNYRRISLCNTIYKLITKLIVLKIRPFLDQVISPLQSAFVPG